MVRIMRAEIRSVISTDIGSTAVEDYRPEDPNDVYLLVRLSLGSDDGAPGEDIFDIVVCTPRALTQRLTSERHIWGRYHLIVATWDWNYIRSVIERLIENACATDWVSIMEQLRGYGDWVDYRQ